MKKLSIPFIAITAITLVSCNPFKWEKNNEFYNDKILKQYHLEGLPAVEFEQSHLEKTSKGLKGYFQTEKGELERHGQEIFKYFKQSNYKYGLLIDNSYMFGMPNIFDLFKTRSLLSYASHLDFYKIYNDRYAFFYEVEDQKYEVLIKLDDNEINNKEYNYLLEVSKVSNLRWANQYKEIQLTNENLSNYISYNLSYNEENRQYAGLGIDLVEKPYLFVDVYLTVSYIECGKEDTCDIHLSNDTHASILFTNNDNQQYQDGDIEITDISVYEESAFIYEIESQSKSTTAPFSTMEQ